MSMNPSSSATTGTVTAPTASVSASPPAQGVILMILAMLSVPLVDGLAKYLSASYSPLFLGWARYAVASLVVVPFAAVIRGRRLFPTERRVSHVGRTVCLVAAMTLYFLAVARLPLATAASGYLVGPIIAVVLSVAVLRERMTSGKALGLTCGVAGSLVILQPGGSTDPGILLALGAGILFGFYLIATRQAAQASDPVQTLAFQCVVGTVLLTPQAVQSWRTPASGDVLFFAGLGGFSALSHILSIAAFRFSGASTLAPLVYVELVGAALIGYIAFNEVPGVPTVVGAGFIVVAGLVLLRQDRRERR
jgi:drug/metabolite transporter (DMT)-like permease